jgi:hypothetical protein
MLYRGAERDPQSRFHALLAETRRYPRAEFDGEVEWIAADSSDPDDFAARPDALLDSNDGGRTRTSTDCLPLGFLNGRWIVDLDGAAGGGGDREA